MSIYQKSKWLLISLVILSGYSPIKILANEITMPNEYKVIKDQVNKLAAHNDLGDRPITFTIISGHGTIWSAQDLKLCEKNKCNYYRSLDPFKPYQGTYAAEVNQSIRQAFLFGPTQASAFPGNLISISRSSFKEHHPKSFTIACVLGHELTHLFEYAKYKEDIREIDRSKKHGVFNAKQKYLKHKLKREYEINADMGAALMLFNSGYPIDSCFALRKRLLEYSDWPNQTKGNGNYPGHDEWNKAWNTFIEKHNKNSVNIEYRRGQTIGEWKYDRANNILQFIPITN